MTSYAYDLAGQLVQTTYADGTFITQAYDALGRLQAKTMNAATPRPTRMKRLRLLGPADQRDRPVRSHNGDDVRRHEPEDVHEGRRGAPDVLRIRPSRALIETDYADGTAVHDTYDALGRRTATQIRTRRRHITDSTPKGSSSQ